ncbi:MAG: 2-oxoacid:acceptor oxidoreductase family protein [Candidatus Berkelbacteria bacterium]|nr:2-oxoacid:acceptor oxidoreductase family protein [Candidatus Berkelbacteria bacterium]
MKTVKIILAGEGGQGIQTIAKVLSDAAFKAGFQVAYIPSFGVEQRGTPSLAYLTIGEEEIRYPRFDTADYVVVLQKRAIKVIGQFVDTNTTLIFDSSAVPQALLPKGAATLLGIPATAIANSDFIPKVFNIIVTGKLSQILKLPKELVFEAVGETLGKKFKDEKIKKANEAAFEFGCNFEAETDKFTKATFTPSEENITVKGHGKVAQIVPKRCKGCGICVEKCPVKALSFGETLGVFATPVPDIDLERCIACGNCYRFCPDAAIEVWKVS